jgi:hypothetical protein
MRFLCRGRAVGGGYAGLPWRRASRTISTRRFAGSAIVGNTSCAATRVRAAEHLLCEACGLRADHGDAPANVVRTGGLTRRPGGVHARPRRRHRPRAAGPSARIPTTSSTTTGSTEAATSPLGNSRTCSPPKCAPRSSHCANSSVRPPAAAAPVRAAPPKSGHGPGAWRKCCGRGC